MDASARHRVVILLRDGLLPMEFGIAHRLFSQADGRAGEPLYEVRTCALHPGAVRTDADVTINVARGPEEISRADTLVVPASEDDYEQRESHLHGDLADAMARVRAGTRVASICTGSFVLAAAGMLDGLRATTHWRAAERFRALFPAVRLDPDVLYTDEGHVLTSAGVASGIDLCLHMIRNDHGSRVANHVARGTVVQPHRPGGQAQFIEKPVTAPEEVTTLRSRTWAMDHLERPLTLRDLARIESMSVRTFSRRFRAETGLSAGQWLADQRVELARRLLEETGSSVEEIAQSCGFGNADSLRLHLRSRLGVSPTSYRATFRAEPSRAVAPGRGPGLPGRVGGRSSHRPGNAGAPVAGCRPAD